MEPHLPRVQVAAKEAETIPWVSARAGFLPQAPASVAPSRDVPLARYCDDRIQRRPRQRHLLLEVQQLLPTPPWLGPRQTFRSDEWLPGRGEGHAPGPPAEARSRVTPPELPAGPAPEPQPADGE